MDLVKGVINKFFDEYFFPARTLPAMIFSLFVVTLGGLLANSYLNSNLWNLIQKEKGIIVTLFFLIVIIAGYFLSNFVANIGRSKQDKIFKMWGGAPTTICLRHDNPHVDKHTLARYHIKLENLLSLKMPDKQGQKRNAKGADEKYESCVNYLRNKTRDLKKYLFILKQNVHFGFWRNLWGMKSISLAILIVSILIHVTILIVFYQNNYSKFLTESMAFYCVLAFWFIFWTFIVNLNFVKIAGFRYATALLESLETMEE